MFDSTVWQITTALCIFFEIDLIKDLVLCWNDLDFYFPRVCILNHSIAFHLYYMGIRVKIPLKHILRQKINVHVKKQLKELDSRMNFMFQKIYV